MSGEASSYYNAGGGGGQNGNANNNTYNDLEAGNRHGGYYNNVNYNASAYPDANANEQSPPPGYQEPAAHKGSVHEVPPNGQNGQNGHNNQPQPGQPQQQMQMDGKQDYEQMFQVPKDKKYKDWWAGVLVSAHCPFVRAKEN